MSNTVFSSYGIGSFVCLTLFRLQMVWSTSEPISCYVCDASPRNPYCAGGNQRLCAEEEVCYREIRVENGIYRATYGCKHRQACKNLLQENYIHCDSGKPPCPQNICQPRLCRTCCWNEDNCNINPNVLRPVEHNNAAAPTPVAPTASPPKTPKLIPALFVLLPDGVNVEDVVDQGE